ncbi:MAG TPA: dihydroneopterin aldolase [Acidimicrobiales bacterium]|nr:dihydroneopterin aldolase [Acidimicrobiales bacterium]
MSQGEILVHGLRVLAHVGVPEAERAQLQPLSIDLALHVDLSDAARSDDVADTVDYGAVSVAVADAVTAGPVALLERLAAVAADAALAVDQRTSAVTVTVTKLRPPIPRDVAASAVRLHRERA